MRKKSKLALAGLLTLAGGGLTQAKVLVVKPADAGTPAHQINLTVETKVTFSEKDFKIVPSPDEKPIGFDYTDVRSISFSNDTVTGPGGNDSSANERLYDAARLRLACNPVGGLLRINGHDGSRTVLKIAAMTGTTVFSTIWQGEDLDVSGLKPGLYFVTIHSKTIKFIKK